MATSTSSSTNHDHALQVIKKYRTYVDMIVDATISKFLGLGETNNYLNIPYTKFLCVVCVKL